MFPLAVMHSGYMQNEQERTNDGGGESDQKLEVLSEGTFWMTPYMMSAMNCWEKKIELKVLNG